MAGEVNLTTKTNRSHFPVIGTPQLIYVLVEATPTEAVAGMQMPINFCMVLDHSGSMAGPTRENPKLKNLKEAAKLAVDRMTPEDTLSVVIFDDTVDLLVPGQTVSDKDKLKEIIDGIEAIGGTTMSLGMRMGLDELKKSQSPDSISRMLLLTDGDTYGDYDACREIAAEAGSLGISIVALGLGDEWNEQLLQEMAVAAAPGSDTDFIPEEKPETVLDTFERTVRSAQGAVIQNATLLLRLAGGIAPRQVWRVTPLIGKLSQKTLSERDVQVELGELDRGESQSLLVELTVPSMKEGQYRLAQAELQYDVASLNLKGEKAKTDVVVDFTADSEISKEVAPEVMNIIEKVTAHSLQTRALQEAAAGEIARATQKLRAAATRLLNLGEVELAEEAEQQAENLEKEGQLSPKATKKLSYETRRLTQKLD